MDLLLYSFIFTAQQPNPVVGLTENFYMVVESDPYYKNNKEIKKHVDDLYEVGMKGNISVEVQKRQITDMLNRIKDLNRIIQENKHSDSSEFIKIITGLNNNLMNLYRSI